MHDAVVLKTLASPRRREMVRLLWNGEQTAGAIRESMPDITFGAVSLQLGVLAKAGLVSSRVDGRYRVYRLHHEQLAPFAALLERMWDDALFQLTLRAELEQSRRGPRPHATRRARTARMSSTHRRG